ncbi:hypothetical protein F4781DRAFT_428393 [Annulohypoxylon bovei var. microspora]|nr:hypothetical protein F4781DRAFT_428393 [Annulohypoxylon bovei var. microspora]
MAPFRLPTAQATIISGYVTEKQKELTVNCHDHEFKKVTIIDNASGKSIFYVRGKPLGTSWSWRRTLFNKKDDPIFDFRHENLDLKNKWMVEIPNENMKILCSLVHNKQLTSEYSAIDATVLTVMGTEVGSFAGACRCGGGRGCIRGWWRRGWWGCFWVLRDRV